MCHSFVPSLIRSFIYSTLYPPFLLSICSKGIAGTHGPFWREQRKFIHSVFREFGVGRPVFEEKIQEEISYFLQVTYEECCLY